MTTETKILSKAPRPALKTGGTRSTSFFSPLIQPRLTINQPNDIYEQEADAVASKVMRMSTTNADSLFFQPKPFSISAIQRKCTECEEEEKVQMKSGSILNGGIAAPLSVQNVINSGGQPMDGVTRNFMESRFGYDFDRVRIHNDSLAHQSSKEINAFAYTHGNHIAFGSGYYQPDTNSGKQLLAHELTHVVQQDADRYLNLVQGYRPKGSANFGACDTSGLKEDSFDTGKDKDKKPWIEEITIKFDATTTDTEKDMIPTGNLKAVFFNTSKPDISVAIAGGKASQGLSNDGNHTVTRIEGCGYHHTSVPKAERIARHKRAGKYFKDTTKATMNFAVFFIEGKSSGNQAIHEGSFTTGSLACVHVPDAKIVQQINYHAVKGLTKVNVNYEAAPLKSLCCERFKAVDRMVSNPCKGQKQNTCP